MYPPAVNSKVAPIAPPVKPQTFDFQDDSGKKYYMPWDDQQPPSEQEMDDFVRKLQPTASQQKIEKPVGIFDSITSNIKSNLGKVGEFTGELGKAAGGMATQFGHALQTDKTAFINDALNAEQGIEQSYAKAPANTLEGLARRAVTPLDLAGIPITGAADAFIAGGEKNIAQGKDVFDVENLINPQALAQTAFAVAGGHALGKGIGEAGTVAREQIGRAAENVRVNQAKNVTPFSGTEKIGLNDTGLPERTYGRREPVAGITGGFVEPDTAPAVAANRFYQGEQGVADSNSGYVADTGPTAIMRRPPELVIEDGRIEQAGGREIRPDMGPYVEGRKMYRPPSGDTAVMPPSQYGELLNPVPPMTAAEQGTTFGRPADYTTPLDRYNQSMLPQHISGRPPVIDAPVPVEYSGKKLSPQDLSNAEVVRAALSNRKMARDLERSNTAAAQKAAAAELVAKKVAAAPKTVGSKIKLPNIGNVDPIEPQHMRIPNSAEGDLTNKPSAVQNQEIANAKRMDDKYGLDDDGKGYVSRYLKENGIDITSREGLDHIAMGGASPKVLDALGTALYSRDRAVIVAKEGLQNSFDEHRIAGVTHPIKVFLNRGATIPDAAVGSESGNSLTIRDFGRGMTPDQLYTQFTDLGESGKGDEESASGGFGFAKAAPMLGGEYFQAESIVNEGGKPVKYTFKGNPRQMKDQKIGVPLIREVMPDGTSTGLKFTTFFNNEQPMYEVENLVKGITEMSPSITSPVQFANSYYNSPKQINEFLDTPAGNPAGLTHERFEKQPALPLRDSIEIPGSKIDIRFDDPERGSQGRTYDLHTLNKGLYQTTQQGSYGSADVPNVPNRIVVDVSATVKEGETGYPFTLNREQLDRKVTNAIDKWITENVTAGAQKNRVARLQKDYDRIDHLFYDSDKVNFLDVGKKFTEDELNQFRESPVFKEGVSIIEGVHSEILKFADGLGWSTVPSAKLKKFGLLFSQRTKNGTTLGIHIPEPSSGGKSSAILVNVMEHLASVLNSPDPLNWLSTGLVGTISHEIAHIPGGGHDTSFSYRHDQLIEATGKKQHEIWLNKISQAFGDENGNIHPEIRDLLEIYDKSREREASSDDDLLGTGVNQKRPSFGTERNGTAIERSNETKVGSQSVDNAFDAERNNDLPQRIAEDSRPPVTVQELQNAALDSGSDSDVFRELAYRYSKQLTEQSVGGVKIPERFNERRTGNRTSNDDAVYQRQREAVEQRSAALRNVSPIGEKTVQPIQNGLPPVKPFGERLKDTLKNQQGSVPRQDTRKRSVSLDLGKLTPEEKRSRPPKPTEPRSKLEEVMLEIGNLSRALTSSLDVSAPFRQGAGMVTEKAFWKNMPGMFKAFASEGAYDRSMAEIENHPDHILSRKAGLALTDLKKIDNREERFQSKWADKIGTFGVLPDRWSYVKMSGRAYTTFLNHVRYATFTQMLDASEKSGGNARENIKLAKEFANTVNTLSGRGRLGPESFQVPLNAALFSPRLMGSRLQSLNPWWYLNPKIDPITRSKRLRSLSGLAAMGAITYTAAKLFGLDVETDPRSSDFLQVKVGKHTRFEMIPGGYAQYIHLAAMLLPDKLGGGVKVSPVSGRRTQLDSGNFKSPTRKDELYSFVEKKMTPNVSLIRDVLDNQTDFKGAKLNWTSTDPGNNPLLSRVLPISAQDAADMIQNEDKKVWPLMIPASMGWGVQTFSDQPFSSPSSGKGRRAPHGSLRPKRR